MTNYWLTRYKSLKYAIEGISGFFKNEVHAKLHLILATITIFISICCGLTAVEWLFVLLAITLVLITEMINTCIERIMNYISKDYDTDIKMIKDLSAGAVLVAAAFACSVACVILLPKIWVFL
ncbi:diacylglycerol kinase family protein [Arcticibacter eurypsychrophilus]|uniref:diacylglycerol kinase family protein n=1 Tax=Arcticibacter eurypsychrophilus TaxID=1434752 RepID=UPI00084D8D44|nr:diacylglycerol kinase family protein [Arcticibacter eurypsychrophilus]